jgi:hypothetical protein
VIRRETGRLTEWLESRRYPHAKPPITTTRD